MASSSVHDMHKITVHGNFMHIMNTGIAIVC